MGETRDEYSMIYRINAKDEWLNGAYDEEGNVSVWVGRTSGVSVVPPGAVPSSHVRTG